MNYKLWGLLILYTAESCIVPKGNVTYVCEGDFSCLRWDLESTSKIADITLHVHNKDVVFSAWYGIPNILDKRMSLRWNKGRRGEFVDFEIGDTTTADGGIYTLTLYSEKGNLSLDRNLHVLGNSACPDWIKFYNPNIDQETQHYVPEQTYGRRSTQFVAKLRIEVPGADPPVTGSFTTPQALHQFMGKRETSWIHKWLFFEGLQHVTTNVTLNYLTFLPSTTVVKIKEPEDVFKQNTPPTVAFTPHHVNHTVSANAKQSSGVFLPLTISAILLSVCYTVGLTLYLIWHRRKVREKEIINNPIELQGLVTESDQTSRHTNVKSKNKNETLLKRYLSSLRHHVREKVYQKNQALNREFGIVSEEVFYVDLCMESSQSKVLYDNPADVEAYLRRSAQSFEKKNTISIKQIFQPLKDGEQPPSRVLLLGGAGMGKTTIAQKQIQILAAGKSKNETIEAAYHFECRRFTSDILNNKKCSFADLLFARHGPSNIPDETKNIVLNFLQSNQTKVQITLDGLDELAKWNTCSEGSPEIVDMKEEADIHVIIYNLVKGHILPHARIFVTSRPYGQIYRSDFDKIVTALGFSEKSIKECLKAMCKADEGLYDKILQYVEDYGLLTYCVVPLTCVLLGAILRTELTSTSSKTLTVIIDSMVRLYTRFNLECISRRRIQSEDTTQQNMFDLRPHQRDSIAKLAALAARGMFGESIVIVFYDKDLTAVNMTPEEYSFGLLEVVIEEQSKLSDFIKPHMAFFLHLTVQEYFAALHVCLEWDEEKVVKLFKSDEQKLDMVRQFVAGLLGDPMGRKFIQAVKPNAHVKFDGLARSLLNALSERKQETEEQRKSTTLFTTTCVREGRMEKLIPEIQQKIHRNWMNYKTLNLCQTPGGLLLHHLSCVGYWLKTSTTVQGLRLMDNSISPLGVATLVKACDGVIGLKALDLAENDIGDLGVKRLCHFLKANKDIEVIHLQRCGIGDEGARQLMTTLKNCKKLKEMRMNQNDNITENTRIAIRTEFDKVIKM